MDGLVLVLLILAGLLLLINLVLLGIRALWHVGTQDWFGIDYDNPNSPYYHDRTGQGRGHDR